MSDIKVLPTITTMPPVGDSNTWQEKIEETKELELGEASLFLTGLDHRQRQEFYKRLEKTPLNRAPHVHLRNDMTPEELDYLNSKWGTEIFNTHPTRERPLLYNWEKYFSRIYIENTKFIPAKEELQEFGGLCLDFAHWENAVLMGYSNYESLKDLAREFFIGCSHLSPIKPATEKNLENSDYHAHYMEEVSEFDYLKKYEEYLPKINSIEVKNSLRDQLQIKKYVEDNILPGL